MPSHDITFCSREHNKCKRRNACFRYTTKHLPESYVWYGDHWQLYGKECELFLPNGSTHETSGG